MTTNYLQFAPNKAPLKLLNSKVLYMLIDKAINEGANYELKHTFKKITLCIKK